MRTRILRTNQSLLQSRVETEGKVTLARAVGIHLTTLNGLLTDSWERIERDTIEALCDHLGCELTDLLTLTPEAFWQPFREAASYRILRGILKKRDVKVPLEEPAKTSVIESINTFCPNIFGGFADELSVEKEIIDYARNNNCIVIGANPSNVSCEVLVSRFFDAEPRNPRPDNRKLIPFRIVRPGLAGKKSAVIESGAPPPAKSRVGIYSEELADFIVETDWLPAEAFAAASIDDGHDAAIILVVNRPFSTTKNVKLIVLAGFSSPGTLAAAIALARDYKDLEPIPPQTRTLGVIDARFKKLPGSNHREVVSYEWVYLEGGRRTIVPKLMIRR